MTYEGERAMFEAYGGRRYASTGVIQWMLNNAWPSLIWHLYDYYLVPAGGYFGTKKACEPVHIQYSYDDKSVIVVNTTNQPLRKLKVTAQVYDLNMVEKFSRTTEVELSADSSVKAFSIPQVNDLSATYFLKLTLDAAGQMVSSNFYWLSTTDDVLDSRQTKWYYTPLSSYADMTGLAKLPAVSLKVSGNSVRRGRQEIARVDLTNPSRSLAFFIHLQIKRGETHEDVVPVFWEDNYFSLLPGERRQITANYPVKDLGNAPAFLVVEAWNSSPVRIPLAERHRQ
jgi:exo-1,4-beta-D-glucosaminidase